MKKLKAFTLMELLIGMIISSIVIGFGYGAYSMIYRQFLDYKKTKEEMMDVSLFKSALSNDIFQADQIYLEGNKIRLKREKEELFYEFDDSFIIRKVNELTDTFKIQTSEITAVYALENSETNKLITGFNFNAKLLGDEQNFNFTKKYSAKILMEAETDTEK